MNIIVSKDIVKLNENHSENHYGEYNVNECVFEFDEYFDSIPIKKAIFTSQSNNKSFEIDIINNKCTVPHEVLTKVYDIVILGVYGYDVNEETLLVRYSPEPTTFVVHEGSYKEGAERPEIITPTQYDMFSKALQEGLSKVDDKLVDVEKQGDYANTQGDYAKEQGDYAKEQGTNAKNVADDTQKKAQEGAFDGKSLEFVWEGTKLGVRLEGQEEYHFVDLQGKQGEIGATGEPFKIKKTYASVSEMNADFRNMEFGDYVMIASSVEVEDNAKLYTRGESSWIFISDFSGAMGIRGETGLTPNIKIGEVKTLEAGSQAKVTRSGSNEEPVFNFELPKGDKGDNYVLTEEDKVEIGEKVNTEYEKRIAENEKDIVDLETYLDNLTPKSSAKGELVHITDALNLPTFETKTSGNVNQKTTSGKNLFNPNKPTTTLNGITLTNNGNGTYTISGTSTKSTGISLTTSNIVLENGKTYTQSVIVTSGEFKGSVVPSFKNSAGEITYNFFINNSKNTPTDTLTLHNYDYYIAEATTVNVTFKVQLEKGTQATEWEEYTGGQASPNPEYPQEIEVLEGYNLFDVNSITENTYISDDGATGTSSVTNLSDYIEVESKTKYILSYDYLSLLNTNQRNIIYYDKDKKYISGSICKPTDKIYTITTPSNTKYLRFSYDKNCYDIQLTKGATKKPYFPYGCVGYKVNGKNLLDKDNCLIGYTINATTGVEQISVNNGASKSFIKIKPNTTYTFSANNTMSDLRISEYSTKQEHIKRTITSSSNIYTFTTTADTHYVKLSWNYNNTTMTQDLIDSLELMLEPSLSRTNYEPYKEQITYLDLKGHWVGAINDNIKDYLVTDKKKYWLVKVVDEYVFDGSEQWFAVEQSGIYRFVTNVVRNVIKPNTNIICTHFLGTTGVNELYTDGVLTNPSSGAISVYVEGMTLEEFKTFAKEQYDKGTPITIVYELAQPYTEDLGELPEPIKTFEGTNNIQLLANLDTEIEVTYVLDVKKYFENKLASIQEQIL